MDTEIKNSLLDIEYAIIEIERFFDETNKDFEVYSNEDPEVKHSVETHIETIADALKDILQKQPGITLSNAQKIIDTQNSIVNDHQTVTDEMIWSIVINHLETLKAEVEKLINE